MKKKATALCVLLASLLGAGSAKAEVIERVVAVVNDDAIFLSELRRRASPFLARAMAAPTETARMAAIEQLYRELLERMIQEELYVQAAERMQVTVTRAEVDRAIGNVMQQSRLSEEDFWEAVRAQGFTPEQYRADVRRQLLRLKVLNQRARGRVNITEEQVRERYDMMIARQRRTLSYSVDQVFVPVPSGASATEVAAARTRAEQVRDAMHGASDFEQAMASVGGGSLGTLNQGDLPEALEQVVLGLEVGEISRPVRGPSGFHIFLLRDRQEGAANAPSYEQVRMRIYQEMMEEAMAHQEEIFLAELRRQAVIDVRL
ncbi:MAG TPA: SurA N-terminal domain-containing protein [Sandaracinaceae bacterium]